MGNPGFLIVNSSIMPSMSASISFDASIYHIIMSIEFVITHSLPFVQAVK
jgi:hypothetical protein